MALSVGQHTNDKELSYYAQTPCGVEWEVGWNPIVVDESTLETHHISGNQHLGSHPEGQTVIDKLEQFAVGARSLLHREDTVAELSAPGIADD